MKRMSVLLMLALLPVVGVAAIRNEFIDNYSNEAKSIDVHKPSSHHGAKAPARISVTAIYEPSVNQVLIEFLCSIGSATARLTNLDTAAEVSCEFSSSSTSLALPVLSDGNYELVFELSSGGRLYGTFNTD